MILKFASHSDIVGLSCWGFSVWCDNGCWVGNTCWSWKFCGYDDGLFL